MALLEAAGNSAAKPALAITSLVFGIGATLAMNVAAGWHHGTAGALVEGSEEHRISLLAAESDLHPRLIRIALDYAAEHPGEIRERIHRNRDMAERSRRMAQQRELFLA